MSRATREIATDDLLNALGPHFVEPHSTPEVDHYAGPVAVSPPELATDTDLEPPY